MFDMVAIKATGKCKRSYGTINVSAKVHVPGLNSLYIIDLVPY